MNEKRDWLLLPCMCRQVSHTLQVETWGGEEKGMFYFSVIASVDGLWARVQAAIAIIWRGSHTYGETLLSPDEARELVKFIEDRLG